MIVFIFGDANKATPSPRKARSDTMKIMLVPDFRNVITKSPTAVAAIPNDASFPGWTLSESLPTIGENMAMTTGRAMRANPDAWEVSPFIYCK